MKKYIGKRVCERRHELGINQQTLADLSGVGINTIVAIERGNGNPSMDTLEKVLKSLGLEISL